MDKAARAAMLTAKGMDKTSENIADYVAELLRQGRAKEITDDLMEQADPQRLHHHYTTGNTGQSMPMNYASRMARAAQMGFSHVRRSQSTETPFNDVPWAQFSQIKRDYPDNGNVKYAMERLKSYGQAQWLGKPSLNGIAAVKQMVRAGRESKPFHGVTGAEVARQAFPQDIVTGADLWDDRDTARHVTDEIVNTGGKSIQTPDGMVAFGKDDQPHPTDNSVRSYDARFDPRLDHLAHLNASAGGAMDFARHVEAVQRAGGQIAPSKYLPNVPRQVHADGGSVTDTDDFRNWFRNSATHTDGDPHVLYTGTSKDKDFTSFNVGRHGTWFTRDPALASQYAEQNDSQGYKQDGLKLTPINTASRVIPAYVRAENPYTGDLPDEVLRDNYKKAQSDWFDTLRRKGHDAWVPARYNGDLVVALKEPQQIKSIFNNGKFDPNQKHMSKAGGGEVDGEEDGITAYHGSAYDFPQFDISKLGTGTGHQAKGHGLYFAGNETDARMYREMLKNNNEIDVEHESGKLGIPLDRDTQADLKSVSKNAGGDPMFAAMALQGRNPSARAVPREKLADLIDRHRKSTSGHMYKVKLNVKPKELLDWDKPLSEQHPNVQAALSRTMPDYTIKNMAGMPHAFANGKIIEINPDGLTGRDAYVLSRMGKSTEGSSTHQDAKAASEHLLSEGIKGIRYGDTGSKNYVMFHHDPLQVTDKYEYGGMVGKEEGGSIGDNRINFIAGNHPEVPPIVYHGTRNDFKEFYPLSHLGTNDAAHERIGNGSKPNHGYWDGEGRLSRHVMPVHLSMKNPLDVGPEKNWQDHREMLRQVSNHLFKLSEQPGKGHYMNAAADIYDLVHDPRWGVAQNSLAGKAADVLKRIGYDGIMYTNTIEDPGNRSFVALHPNQIKSAIGNNGNFDPNDPDMTKSEGGTVGKEEGGTVDDDNPAPVIQNPMSIFPKPQRMFPEDQRPKGGQYISTHNKADVTGHKAEAATIGIGPNGKPFFQASQNAVDQTGTVGKGSATTKTNLFKQKAGWKWQDAPEGHENTETIVSVEHRGKHFYALNAHFPKGVDLARYENATSEPRLRPTTQGNVTLGPQAGSISVRGKMHPVYHHVIVKADGGMVGKEEGGDMVGNPEYSTGHTAPHPEEGGMLHDPDAMFPDIATHGRQYYGTGADYDHESFDVVSKARHQPSAPVFVYRAVSHKLKDPQINTGDWVTASPSYAREHGEANVGGKYKILKKRVRADELATNGDSIHEWGYWPKDEGRPMLRGLNETREEYEARKQKNIQEYKNAKGYKASGGAVDDALALTRRFTKDGAGATMALKPNGK